MLVQSCYKDESAGLLSVGSGAVMPLSPALLRPFVRTVNAQRSLGAQTVLLSFAPLLFAFPSPFQNGKYIAVSIVMANNNWKLSFCQIASV